MSLRHIVLIFVLILCAWSRTAPADPPPPPTEEEMTPPPLEQLRAHLATLEKSLADGALPADSQNLDLFRFKLEQGDLWLSALDNNSALYPLEAQRLLSVVVTSADAVGHARGDAVFPAPTQVHERA